MVFSVALRVETGTTFWGIKQMDEADLAQHQVDMFLKASILNQQQNAAKQPANDWPYGVGRCKNCGDAIDDGRPYCEEYCRDDHWDRIKAAARRGRK
jgi:hypothetical protein